MNLRQKPRSALWLHPHPRSLISIQAHLTWKDGERQCRDRPLTIPYSPTCTYLQGAVLKVLAGVQLVLQDWEPPSVKGLYGTIYGERGLE